MCTPHAIGSRAAALALSAGFTVGLLSAMLTLGIDRSMIRHEAPLAIELLPLSPIPPSVEPLSANPVASQRPSPSTPVPAPPPVVPVHIVPVELATSTSSVAAILPPPPFAVAAGSAAKRMETAGAGAAPPDVPATIPPDAEAFSRDNAPPLYPESARRRREQGVVVVSVWVSAEGRVTAIRVRDSSGHSVLDDAALAAVRHWRFAPATRAGVPVAAQGYVELPFVLKRH